MLRRDQGDLIADFTVMQPLSGVIPFAQEKGERALREGPSTTRS